MLNLKVINIWGAPGVGKSTTAAGLFNLMKAKGHSVEIITEVAKDLTYEKMYDRLSNQLYILGEQDLRLRRLEGQVEWVITDSPLPTGLAFITQEYRDWLTDAVWGAYDRYNNYDILLKRNLEFGFQQEGRNENYEQALALDETLANLHSVALNVDTEFGLKVTVSHTNPYVIYNWLMEEEEE